MVGITALVDLWKKNQSFSATRTYQSPSLFTASAIVAPFAAVTSFASKDFFRTPIAYCDAGATISEHYIPSAASVPGKYFYHDSLKYNSKHYDIAFKPFFSAFDLKSFSIITLRSFLMFYLPLLEPHAKMEQDDDEFPQHKQGDLCCKLSVPFRKSILQIIREVAVVTTTRILERLVVRYVSRKRAWRLLKDVPESAARKAGRKMPSLVYFYSVSRATFRGHLIGFSASWLVQVGIRLFQFFNPMSKNNDGISKAERMRILRHKVFIATVRCNASLIFASVGAAIGATLFRPSIGQWVGGVVGDLVGPVIVAVCAEKVFCLKL
ncbi:uncharacterized protein LOC113851216 [Abrus precatorius]|uniref:Uncharacterized protein LOC113851216 n=1 Tax=Abrus precatorius TaxID=3816 RepID=A0A8B8K255_ABRPR|nr:uncharacterized protein LOC113851216 [Abrus precatorius]